MKTSITILFVVVCAALAQPPIGLGMPSLSTGSSAASQQSGTAVLTVTSGFASRPGALNPLGGSPLVLFKESFEGFLRRKGMFQGPPGATVKVSPLAAWAYACQTGSRACQQALYEMRPSSVGESKADAAGKTTLPGVPAGTYFLFSVARYNNQFLVWDLRVDLKPGANSVVLDQRNSAPLDSNAARSKDPASEARQPASGTTAARPADAPPAPPRPSGPKNSTLTLQAFSESRQPVGGATFYLLDDDFESILKRAGFERQMLLGEQLPLLNSFELVVRWKRLKETNPAFRLIEGMTGESALPEDIEQQYAIAMKALSEHTVATVKTNIYGKASLPALAAGNYYVYGTSNQFVKTGARGTVVGNTVTLNDTGYQKATIWNLRVTAKPGQNSITLTPDNAAFVGN